MSEIYGKVRADLRGCVIVEQFSCSGPVLPTVGMGGISCSLNMPGPQLAFRRGQLRSISRELTESHVCKTQGREAREPLVILYIYLKICNFLTFPCPLKWLKTLQSSVQTALYEDFLPLRLDLTRVFNDVSGFHEGLRGWVFVTTRS